MIEKAAAWLIMLLMSVLLIWMLIAAGRYFWSDAPAEPAAEKSSLLQTGFEKADECLFGYLPWNDYAMDLQVDSTILLGNHKFGEVYVTEERFLPEITELSEESIQKTADAINAFYKKYEMPVCIAAVPTATEFYQDKLPENTIRKTHLPQINHLYENIDSQIRKIDVYHILMPVKEDYIYYRTDRNWTAYGAYCTYRSMIQKMGYYPVSYDKFSVLHRTNHFHGDLYARCRYQKITPDIIDEYCCESGNEIVKVMYRNAEDWTEGMAYDSSALQQNHANAFYFGEDTEQLRITTNTENGQRLLVCKDACGNVMLPFLAQHYQQIDVIDLTHLTQPIEKIVKPEEYQQVVFLCKAETYEQSELFDLISEDVTAGGMEDD